MDQNYNNQYPSPAGAFVHTPGFGGGSQSGSDFDFGTPQSLNIDAMMQSGDLNSFPSFQRGPMPHGYTSAFDPHVASQMSVSEPHLPHLGSTPDGQIGHHRHLSVGSSGLGANNENIIGENGLAHNSNDSITSHPQSGEPDSKDGDSQSKHPPAWSELKTKAGKERKRLPLACIACRRKKIRCSGEKPACKHCLRSRIPCVYKLSTRKPAPRTDYMAMLDKRLKRMEERVIKIIPKGEQGIVSSTGRAVVKPALPPATPKSATSTKKRPAEAAFEEELDEWAETKPRIPVNTEETDKEPAEKQDSDEQNLLEEGADRLPSKEIQEHLSEVFFDNVYGQSYPLLHKPSFMRRLAQGQVPPVLMLAVCAISARFSNHPEVRTEPAFLRGEDWGSAAREIALRRYDTPNITILIVYLILGLHEFGTCQGGRSWMFGGMAQRMAYALQLHKDLDHDPKSRNEKSELTFTDREIRRRTMWSCFLMDRFNSSGTERPIFVGEQYIRAQLPIKERFYQMEITGPTEDLEGNVPNPADPDTGQTTDAKENMGVAAYLIRLVAVWGKLINYMNLGGKEQDEYPMWDESSRFQQLKRLAKEWLDSLPESIVYSADNLQNHASENIANQFLFLHIVYNQIILFMDRWALPTPGSWPKYPKDMPAGFISESTRSAHEAANQISALVHEAMDHQVVAPFAGYCAFYSSTVHIYGAFSKNSALEASSKQNLAWNVKYLTKMKKYWGMFHFVTENLRDLYRKHADAARSGSKPGNRDSDQSIFQYGDWFDRYPHGVSGTDYEEPSAEIKKEPGADAVLGHKSDLQTVEEFFSKLAPPSRAVQQQQQPQARKTAKRRNTRSEGKQSGSQVKQEQDDVHPAVQATQSTDEVMLPAESLPNLPDFSQESAALPADFQHPMNSLFMNTSQQLLPQLDRQMVLDSYAGVSGAHNNNFGQGSLFDTSGQVNWNNFDFNALNSNSGNTPGGGGVWGDQSTAWFMPFNMDPPAAGEDSSLWGGNIDWSNMMGLSGLPPTGLTPGGDINVETGQGDAVPDGGEQILDGLDGMQ